MSRVFVTADLHIGHPKIVEKYRTEFRNVDEHDEAMVQRWNARVTDRDDVLILGDIGLCAKPRLLAIAQRLRGHVSVCPGNHDSKTILNGLRGIGWTVMPPLHRRSVGALGKCTLCHYPLSTWAGRYTLEVQLHGHSHSSQPLWEGRTLPGVAAGVKVDVGLDGHGLEIWDSEELMDFLLKAGEFERVQAALRGAGEYGQAEV